MCLRNQDGFSLIQVLLLSAALSASALVAIQTFKTQKEDIKEADVKDRVEQIHNAVYSILQNRNHCLATVVGNLGSTTITPNQTLPLNSIYLSNPTVPTATIAFQTGVKYLWESVAIEDMTIIFPPDLKDPATLNIVYNRFGNRRTGTTDTIRKSFQIFIQRSAPDQINSCSSITIANGLEGGNQDLTKQMCGSLPQLFTWDDTLKRCQIKDSVCPTDRIFTGLDASGNKICKPLFDFLPYLIDSSFVQTCPDDYDQIKFNRTFTTPNYVSIECNKKNSTCPSIHNLTWTDTPSLCYGYLPRGTDGGVYTATDVTPPVTGSISYQCNAGAWSPVAGSEVCVAPCLAQTLTWGGGNCSGDVTLVKNGQFAYPTDSTLPSIGSATFKCVDGSWSGVSSICKTPCTRPAGTPPLVKSWSASGNTCNAEVPDLDDGDTAYVTDSIAPSTGYTTFKCSNGSYSVVGPSTCNVPPTPGTCKWATVTTWENADCTGFQLNTAPNAAAPVPVTSPSACTSKCGVCMGSVSYNSCVFTPL